MKKISQLWLTFSGTGGDLGNEENDSDLCCCPYDPAIGSDSTGAWTSWK